MKKNLFYLFSVVCLLGLFTACSDDDDVQYPINEELSGAYKGSMDIYYEGIADPITSGLLQKVYISKASNDAIKFELKNFSVIGDPTEILVEDITVDHCVLKQKGDTYSFSGDQTLDIVVGKCNVNVSGQIGKGSLDMEINVDVIDRGLKVKVNFDGKKLSGSESSEAKILSFTFDKSVEANSIVKGEPVMMGSNITFSVGSDVAKEQLKALVPTITVSEKATINPASGVKADFASPVTYQVIAEDGTVSAYVVTCIKGDTYDFDEWYVVNRDSKEDLQYSEPVGGWVTTNAGLQMIKLMYSKLYSGPFSTVKIEPGVNSSAFAAQITTVNTTGQPSKLNGIIPAIPMITSGSLFTGTFQTDMKNTLNSTKFGVPYVAKPLKLKGHYKYIPGEKYYTCPDPTKPHVADIDESKTDQCSIVAVLYEVENDEEVLTGVNINTSDKVVLRAEMFSGFQEDWKAFDLDFNLESGKEYVTGKKYKLAIICSSSRWGDAFSGAPGSTLTVDELEVIAE